MQVVDNVGLAQAFHTLRHGRRELKLKRPLYDASLDFMRAFYADFLLLVPEHTLVYDFACRNAAHEPPADLALALESHLGLHDAHALRSGEPDATGEFDIRRFMLAAMEDYESGVGQDLESGFGLGAAARVRARGGDHGGRREGRVARPIDCAISDRQPESIMSVWRESIGVWEVVGKSGKSRMTSFGGKMVHRGGVGGVGSSDES